MAKLESKLSVKNEQLKQNQLKIMKLKKLKKMENYKFKFTLAELEKTQFQFQYRIKFTEAELEKIQFQFQIARLEQRAGAVNQPRSRVNLVLQVETCYRI